MIKNRGSQSIVWGGKGKDKVPLSKFNQGIGLKRRLRRML